MARTQSVRREDSVFPVRSSTAIRRQDVARYLPSEQALRRSIPILIGIFLLLTAASVAAHFLYAKGVALDQARARLSLTADAVAAELRAGGSTDSGAWQRDLARTLPSGSTFEGRRVLIADNLGTIRATAPLTVELIGRPLRALLGPDAPLTLFGAQAGVLDVTLADGRRAIVAARNLPQQSAQIAVMQLTEEALQHWRSTLSFNTTLLSTMALVLLLIGGAFWFASAQGAAANQAAVAHDLEGLLSETGYGLWDWNIARGRVQWSQTMHALLGRQPQTEALPFREVAAVAHSEDDLYGAVERAVRGGARVFDQSLRMRHADGRWLPMRLRGTLARIGGEPHLIAMACTADQVSARLPDAAADMRLSDAVEALSEAFVLWDADNRLMMCNGKYREFHKLAEDAMAPGTPYEKVVAAAEPPIVRRRVTAADADSAQAQSYEAQFEDGRWLRVNERRTKDGGYVSIGTDITDLKRSEESLFERERELEATVTDLRQSRRTLEQQKQQLVDMAEKYALEKNRAEAASRSKSEFLANMSHELRTPLNAVIGFSEVMRDGLFGPIGNEKYLEYSRDIHASGCYLLEVINDILDMSKIEAGRLTLSVGAFDVATIVEDSLRVVSQAAEEKKIALKRTGLKELDIKADRRALKQVLINLLSNAVKFTPEGGRVTVKLARRAEDRCSIAITDTGIGIPESKLGKLGRPFEQVENQLSKSRNGSGLGLAISRSLVEMHGGHLEVTSREGKGTTVTCVLPLRPVLTRSDEAPHDEDDELDALS